MLTDIQIESAFKSKVIVFSPKLPLTRAEALSGLEAKSFQSFEISRSLLLL
jgi:hypothetical protein